MLFVKVGTAVAVEQLPELSFRGEAEMEFPGVGSMSPHLYKERKGGPATPSPVYYPPRRLRSFAKSAQDFGCGPPSAALRVTPAMRLKFIDFRLGLRRHARNSR
jgi:hypothetical protein